MITSSKSIFPRLCLLVGFFLLFVGMNTSAFGGNSNGFVLEADVSIIQQTPPEKNDLENLPGAVTEKEKKFHLTWEDLGIQSMRDSLKKLKPKAWLSAISLKYLYRRLMDLALLEHDRFVGDPYTLGEASANKLAHGQTTLMRDYVGLLSDPELLSKLALAQQNGGMVESGRMQQFAKSNIANLLSPEEAVDFFIYEMSKHPLFPKDPKEYAKFKKLAIQWGAIPIGMIVLGNQLKRNNLGGKIYLPVFLLPSGYLGLAFTARVDHIGLELSPRFVGQGEVILMRFRVKGTIEEKRGKMFSQDKRNFEMELSEDWSQLYLKRFGLTSNFYYKNRLETNQLDDSKDSIHELGLNVSSKAPGNFFGLISYTNFSAKLSADSKKNLQANVLISNQQPNFLWSVSMSGAFNYGTSVGSLSGQTLLQKKINKYGTSMNAGMSFNVGTESTGIGGFVGITDESRNLNGRLQFSVLKNHKDPVKWQFGVGIAGQLESQRRLDANYLIHLDSWILRNALDYVKYENDLLQNTESIIQTSALWESDGFIERDFDSAFQTLILPLAYSLEQVGNSIEKSKIKYQKLLADYERKYHDKLITGEYQSAQESEKINQLLIRYDELKAKGSNNLKSNILFLALAEHFKAD